MNRCVVITLQEPKGWTCVIGQPNAGNEKEKCVKDCIKSEGHNIIIPKTTTGSNLFFFEVPDYYLYSLFIPIYIRLFLILYIYKILPRFPIYIYRKYR